MPHKIRIETTGERMTEDIDNAMQPAGRATPDKREKAQIKFMISEGFTTNELLWFCHNMLDLPITIRTAQRYVKKYGGNKLDIDEPVDWTNLDGMINAGVIQNTIPALHKVNTWVQSKFGTADSKWESTYRDLRWQSYIIASAPITKRMDIWTIGQLLSTTARLAHYQEEEMAVVGMPLIMWLQYAPFESKEADTRYKKAVKDGLIPHVMDSVGNLAIAPLDYEEPVIKTKSVMAVALFNDGRDEHPYDNREKLPTDRIKGTMGIRYVSFFTDEPF